MSTICSDTVAKGIVGGSIVDFNIVTDKFLFDNNGDAISDNNGNLILSGEDFDLFINP